MAWWAEDPQRLDRMRLLARIAPPLSGAAWGERMLITLHAWSLVLRGEPRAATQPRWRTFAERAELHTLQARQTRANGYDRSRILDEIRLAKVRLSQREPGESVIVATNALRLADSARSSVVYDWLIRFHSELTTRYTNEQAVIDFTGQLRDYLRLAAPVREGEVVASPGH